MAIIQKLTNFYKKKREFEHIFKSSKLRAQNLNHFTLLTSLLIITIFFFLITNYVSNKNIENDTNFKAVTKTQEFSNLTNYFISKINSPYK